MLNSFRSFSGSITTKILLLILIASFALWGIGDMIARGPAGHTLATVGSDEITVDAFRRTFAQESENVRRQLGSNYSPELLKRLNVPQYVLQNMTQKSLLSQEAKHMGFIPDDTTVALEIRKNPLLLNSSGVFDKARFETMLRNQSMSEKAYVENLRMQLAIDKLLGSLAIDLPLTDTMLSTVQAAFNQGRTVTIYKLGGSASGTPKEADLEAFHKEHAELFTAPEARTVSFVRFSADSAAKAPTDKEIRDYYDSHTDQFATAERREVEQLLYSDEEKARDAYQQVKAGKKFEAIAKTIQPLNAKALSLGEVDKRSIPTEAADKVFALKRGEATEPVKTPFGWHIFRVVNVESEGTLPLEKARDAIIGELKQQSRDSALSDKMNQMEDALAGGSTLKEAAASMGLKVEEAGTFTRQGNTPGGSKDAQIPDLDRFVEVAFKTDEKTESSVIASKGGTYYVLRVESVAPEKLRPLAEVHAQVAQAYAEAQAMMQSADLASKIDEELARKTPAKEILSTHKLQPAASGTVYRNSKTLGGILLLPSFTQQIFSADMNGLTAPARDKEGSYLVALVSGTAPAAADADKDLKSLKKDLSASMQEEMMLQYLRYLETQYPVSVRQDIFEQLMRGEQDASR